MPIAKDHRKYLKPFNKWWLKIKNQKININFTGNKLMNIVNRRLSWGSIFALPNQIAKKGIENANAITPILLEIENIIVKKGL